MSRSRRGRGGGGLGPNRDGATLLSAFWRRSKLSPLSSDRLGGARARLWYELFLRAFPGLLCAHRVTRTALFREAVRQTSQSCDVLGLAVAPTGAVESALRRILAHEFRVTFFEAVVRASRRDLARWTVLDGLKTLEQAQRTTGGVVVLNSHFGAARAVPLVLARFGYGVYSLEGHEFYQLLDSIGIPRLTELEEGIIGPTEPFPFRRFYRARKALAAGRLMHVLGDGQHGDSQVVRVFFGRLRPFRLGFAALAADTNVAVVPVFASLDSRGRVRIEFREALQGAPTGIPNPQRMAFLVDQYVRLLEHRWTAHPGDVPIRQISIQRECPPAV